MGTYTKSYTKLIRGSYCNSSCFYTLSYVVTVDSGRRTSAPPYICYGPRRAMPRCCSENLPHQWEMWAAEKSCVASFLAVLCQVESSDRNIIGTQGGSHRFQRHNAFRRRLSWLISTICDLPRRRARRPSKKGFGVQWGVLIRDHLRTLFELRVR